ncbi:Ribosome biogenesis ATPase RIX7 [Hanseniaspora opuntiae]|uniref:Ribosome biogenesis ATPase RIX7 n=1 Tax=Hanseniaspora opuntiae TaxID=211096 RepID=A0A1E5R6H2_9ASCO|nr:Ribosome biogenesis ATPase RIX7 [Hanseniaspora opuntiae]
MVKIRSSKKNYITNSVDNKVQALVERFLDEKSVAKQREYLKKKQEFEERSQKVNDNLDSDSSEDDEDWKNDPSFDILKDPYPETYFAKDLDYLETLNFCLSKDLSLKRVKKLSMEKTLDRVLKNVIDAEEKEFQAENEDVDMDIEDSNDVIIIDDNEDPDIKIEKESIDQSNMIPDVDLSNNMNKDIVSTWNVNKVNKKIDVVNSKKRSREDTQTTKSNKKSKTQDRSPPNSDLSQLGGMDDIVSQLMELIGLPILHPEIYKTTGVDPPRGILLHGPPGCGKTTIANAIAGELKVPFISVSAPSVVSGMSGESEKKLRELFDEAKSLAPCIMFFDEIDAITPKRDGGAQREMERRIVAQLLTSMDELSFEKTNYKPVIVIGATNRPDSLDSALRRAGRFDREICLNVPNELARLNILTKMCTKLKLDPHDIIDFSKLAKLTPGFVGADLKSLVTAAGTCAIKRIFKDLVGDDIADIPSGASQLLLKNSSNMIDPLPLQIIQKFLIKFDSPLNSEQLEKICITYNDFLKALPSIQPTAKREGFATVPDVTWNNIGALNKIRVELNMAIVQPIKKPEIYEKVGISAPAGVLLWGPPGCGKTLLAKAVANESRANFISVKGPELLNKYVGESERAIRQVFQRARASIPCIIFFDELDSLVPRRDTSMSESSSRVVNTLLTELDGLNDRNGIFVVGATNRPDMIDPAMLRPGRLDKTLFIELPNKAEKLDILKTIIKCNGTPVADDVDLELIVSDTKCENFSGADIHALVRESSVIALKRNFFASETFYSVSEGNLDKEFDQMSVDSKDTESIQVTMNDFSDALKKIKPSVSNKDRLKYDRLNKKMGWIEEEKGENIDQPPAAVDA